VYQVPKKTFLASFRTSLYSLVMNARRRSAVAQAVRPLLLLVVAAVPVRLLQLLVVAVVPVRPLVVAVVVVVVVAILPALPVLEAAVVVVAIKPVPTLRAPVQAEPDPLFAQWPFWEASSLSAVCCWCRRAVYRN